MKKTDGFTLVEIAVCIVLVGLLIGGVLKGTELLYVSRISGSVDQVRSHIAGTQNFYDKYKDLPGDMRDADTRVVGCLPDNSCVNGDSNGMIGTAGVGMANTAAGNINAENNQYWKHLALAGMIAGVQPNASALEAGRSHPVSKLQGVFTVTQMAATAGDPLELRGLYIRLQNCVTCTNPDTPAGDQPLTPVDAANIDRKMDDGFPYTGSVRTWGPGTGCEGVTYNEVGPQDTRCIQFYELSF